jgi:hypothetical protein
MSEQRTAYTISTTQQIGAITHDAMPHKPPTLREYLLEQRRDLLRKLQRIEDMLVQLPKE